MDGQCGKLVKVVGHQFITLTVDICVQHGGREALHCAGLSAPAETSWDVVWKTDRQTNGGKNLTPATAVGVGNENWLLVVFVPVIYFVVEIKYSSCNAYQQREVLNITCVYVYIHEIVTHHTWSGVKAWIEGVDSHYVNQMRLSREESFGVQ